MGSTRKILIIDDNEANLFSLRKILERLGLVIHTATSGFEGLELSEKNHYSLVLLDIQMPEMDGFETLKRMRDSAKNKLVPVILISAIFTEDQYKIKGIQTGAVDFIPKPVNPEILRAKIKVLLELEEHKEFLKKLVGELKTKNIQLKKEIKKRKKVEADLREAKAKAEKTSELKSKILVNMSHEIRTPVNSILGFADLIANTAIPTSDKERYVRYVSSSSQNLLFLIDEILDHSRIEAGEFSINKAPCSAGDILTELLESFNRIKSQFGKTDITITIHPPAQDLIFETDPQRLRQVLINLLSNALKYTKIGQIEFGCEIKNDLIRFYVKDTGIGISAEEIEHVFSRFMRVESQDSLQSQGTGLGLSIAQKIIQMMGGEIGVESTLNKGSEFFFTLPYIPLETLEKVSVVNVTETIENPDWSEFTLVIAEDEEMNYLFLQEALRATNVKVLWAKNGREAVDIALREDPDLILMDVKMPDMDGFEAIRLIKDKKPGINIIIQTAFAKHDEELKKGSNLYEDFITKPINRSTLLKTMSKFLF
ncbi:MAG: response regulator [Bacteroidota bacterium]|nr:response regulator [Bacteroidota bacterium]